MNNLHLSFIHNLRVSDTERNRAIMARIVRSKIDIDVDMKLIPDDRMDLYFSYDCLYIPEKNIKGEFNDIYTFYRLYTNDEYGDVPLRLEGNIDEINMCIRNNSLGASASINLLLKSISLDKVNYVNDLGYYSLRYKNNTLHIPEDMSVEEVRERLYTMSKYMYYYEDIVNFENISHIPMKYSVVEVRKAIKIATKLNFPIRIDIGEDYTMCRAEEEYELYITIPEYKDMFNFEGIDVNIRNYDVKLICEVDTLPKRINNIKFLLNQDIKRIYALKEACNIIYNQDTSTLYIGYYYYKHFTKDIKQGLKYLLSNLKIR